MKKQEYTINDMIMKRPASAFANRWRDATPIGNGITGALLYGGVSAEHIVINRGDLWYGGINAPYVPDDDPEIPVKTIAIAGATGAGILGFIILMLRRILSR